MEASLKFTNEKRKESNRYFGRKVKTIALHFLKNLIL